jgi:hypothetical protein
VTKLIVAFRNFANAPKNVTDIASLFTVNVAGMMDISKQAQVGKSEGKTLFGKSQSWLVG